jgi:DNA-binding transcriptional ArsR family regulator
MPVAATFKALGDPVRLEMIARLADGSSQTVGSLSDGLGLTRQGARKHLQVLADVNLVTLQTMGRQTAVTLEPDALHAAKSYIAALERRWDVRLAALRELVESSNEEP